MRKVDEEMLNRTRTRLEALAELRIPPSGSLFENSSVRDLINRVGNDSPEVAEPLSAWPPSFEELPEKATMDRISADHEGGEPKKLRLCLR